MTSLLFLLIIFIILTVALSFMPYMTRKTENFGVTIPESLYSRADFKAMRKKYVIRMLLISLVLIGALLIINQLTRPTTVIIVYTIITLVYLMLSFVSYLPFHFKMKEIKEAENWQEDRKESLVIDTTFRNETLTYSNWWHLIPILIVGATIAFTFIIYDTIPDKVPIHTSITGEVTFDDKSPGVLLLLPLTQLFMVGLFLVINYVIKQSKQHVNVEHPETSKRQNILFRRRWSLYTIVMSILITLLFSFLQLTFIYQDLLGYVDPILYSVIGLILVGTIILSITTGQGGSRINVDTELDETVIERDEDKHWKLGQFYVNKDDPSFIIEKRFGVGWTINFARPLAWVIIVGILLLALLPLLFTFIF